MFDTVVTGEGMIFKICNTRFYIDTGQSVKTLERDAGAGIMSQLLDYEEVQKLLARL